MEPCAATWRWNRPARFGLSCLALFALAAALPASAFGPLNLHIPYRHAIYYQTFNLATLVGLFAADRGRWDSRKARLFAGGIAAMGGLHLAFRVCDVLIGIALIPSIHGETAFRVSAAISLIGQYLVPVLFWMLLRQRETAPKPAPRPPEEPPLI